MGTETRRVQAVDKEDAMSYAVRWFEGELSTFPEGRVMRKVVGVKRDTSTPGRGLIKNFIVTLKTTKMRER